MLTARPPADRKQKLKKDKRLLSIRSRRGGNGQSESVTGRDPDVRATLLLNDGFDQVVHLLKTVTVDDGCTHKHTHTLA